MNQSQLIRLSLNAGLAIVALVSPVVFIFIATARATYSGYSERYLTDPGHMRIKKYDQLVIFMSAVLTIAALAHTFNFDYGTFSVWLQAAPRSAALFAIQFSGTASFIILYALSLTLLVYGNTREKIIRRVNEAEGAW